MADYTALTDALQNPSVVTHLEVDTDEDATELLARLAEFTSLQRLYMRNGFAGLPGGVVAPATLTELEVVVADLEAEAELIIAGLPGLEILEIWGRHLKQGTLPAEIEKLSQLRELHLVSCGISDLPDAIGNLASLRELYVRGCPLKGFPLAITRIPNLQRLELRGQFASLPDELANLKELKHLDLTGSLNKGLAGSDARFVKPLPAVLGSLANLEVLKLGQCGASNELDALSKLCNLRILDLSWGQTSDLSGLRPLKNLEELLLENCYNLRDLTPLGVLPKLHKLDISSNHYIEDISSVGHLKQLRELDIEGCSDIENLKAVLEHPTLETLKAREEVMEKWNQRQLLRDMPSEAVLLEQLASDEFPVVAGALGQITAFVQLNSTDQKSAAFSFFGVENEDEEIVDVPVLDAALEKWGSELPPSTLVGVVKMCLVSISENLKPALTAIELLAERGDVDGQKEAAAIFHQACSYYDAGHRFWGSTVLDQLIDDVFTKFHPAALAALLEECGTDALSSESGDAMDALFAVAFGKTEELDEDSTEALIRKFCQYAKEMIGYNHVDHIEELREGIRKVNASAGEAIDRELASEQRKIETAKRVEEVDSADKLTLLLESMLGEGDTSFEELDDVSSFSRLVAKHSADLSDALRMQVLCSCWQARACGWDWARVTLDQLERDADGLVSAMQSFLGTEPSDDNKKHLLSELALAKRIRLSEVAGDPDDSDSLAALLRATEQKLSGEDPKQALTTELSKLLLQFAQGRGDKDWQAALGTLRRIANQEETIATNWEHFSYLQMNFENLVLQGQYDAEFWPQVKDFLRAFTASTSRIEWGQSAIETIAADGVASAQLSGDEEISELVMKQLVPDPIEKDRLAFNLACYHAAKEDKENVMRFTRRALELGKASTQFLDDDDFAPFREDAEFKALLAEHA